MPASARAFFVQESAGGGLSYKVKKKATDLVAFRFSFLLRYPYVGIIQIRFPVEGHTFLSACIQAPVCFIVFLHYRSIFIKEQGLFKIFLYNFYYISPIQVQSGAFPFFAYRETRPQRSRRPYIPRRLHRHSSAYHRWGTI